MLSMGYIVWTEQTKHLTMQCSVGGGISVMSMH